MLDFLLKVDDLAPVNLTVLAQEVDPSDTGQLFWPMFFPRVNSNSIRIRNLTPTDFRPVATHREWNADGRPIPFLTPKITELELVPLEANFTIGEREMQLLGEPSQGDRALILREIGALLPDRMEFIVSSLYRRLELTANKAWTDGLCETTDPKAGSYTTSFGIAATRILTAATAWDDGGENAYNEFSTFVGNGIRKVGRTRGAIMRQATLDEILTDAPNAIPGVASTVEPTIGQVEELIRNKHRLPSFTIQVIEDTVDVFDNAGDDYTETNTWPAQHVALIPPGGSVGVTHFVPVYRSMDLARQIPDAKLDIRGASVFPISEKNGKIIKVEAQLNVFPVPNERNVYVIDAGV